MAKIQKKHTTGKSPRTNPQKKPVRPRAKVRNSRASQRARSVTSPRIILAPIPPMLLFKSIILLATLMVAATAVYNETYDAELWNFLGSMLMYAALTNSHLGNAK